mgnify:CR=1 FL=1
MKSVLEFLQALTNPKLAPTALRVALIIGTIVFAINHGSALIQGKMTRNRWIFGIITYFVPYCVNIHGQLTSQKRHYQ